MSQQERLKRAVEALRAARIEFMLTGSVVSSMQGEPRLSHDVDIVIDAAATDSEALCAAFPPPAFYVAESAVDEAIRRRSMFNVVAVDEGDTIDFWLLTDDAFDRARFARRRAERVFDADVFVSSPEDTILSKLRWMKLSGGSERQFNDALGVYEVQRDALDRDYLDDWGRRLGVEDLWRRVQAQAACE
jgi:hypothetical protein